MSLRNIKIFFDETNVNFFAWGGIYYGFLFSPFVKKFIGDNLSGSATRLENDHGFWGVDLKEWYKLGKKVQTRLAKEELDTKGNLKSLEAVGTRLLVHADKIIGKNLSKMSNQEFVAWLRKAWKDNTDLNGIGFLAVAADFEHNYLSTKLSEILKKHDSPEHPAQSYMAKLVSADRPDMNWRELLELMKIIKKYKVLKKIEQSSEFKKHIQKYNWLNFGFQGPVWERQDFINRVKEILSNKNSIEIQYLEHLNHFKKLQKEQRNLEQELELNNHEKYLFESARIFMLTKALRLNARHKIQYAFEVVFKELGKRFFQPVYFFRYATIGEMIDLLNGRPIETATILKRRSLMLEIIYKNKQQFVPVKKINEVYRKLLIKPKKIKTNYLQGHTAYAGYVKGKVRLVFSLDDLSKVKDGDILVAISTTPDLLPAMIKAKAFVTDQGGITSHAAIVAREMKKPCVIGTKFATKVFKDGDMIEVDANKGTVRKI